ncbi:MAG: nucleotidyl transferase AbiEii/AbiGii toxin family protein [Bacteroidales bacterium]|nr:nucleotidyl transferase AbiEii/AbiGii toxin family protein [Bacteroidales bacterium]
MIILRFIHERFLFRLSVSKYTSNFLLKGGALLYALEGAKTRSTKDIDFLGKNINNDIEIIKKAFVEICSFEYFEDFVWFDKKSIVSHTISDQDKYHGIRVYIDSGFDSIKQRLQIDIGFGDEAVLLPKKINYPLLLDNLKPPRLNAYSIESIIAEKFQIMIEFSTVNSRMKDFYDVYLLLQSVKVNKIKLQLAIRKTFERRNTIYSDNHALFEKEFSSNPSRLKMWKLFLHKARLDEEIDFKIVLELIIEELRPFWESMKRNDNS